MTACDRLGIRCGPLRLCQLDVHGMGTWSREGRPLARRRLGRLNHHKFRMDLDKLRQILTEEHCLGEHVGGILPNIESWLLVQTRNEIHM